MSNMHWLWVTAWYFCVDTISSKCVCYLQMYVRDDRHRREVERLIGEAQQRVDDLKRWTQAMQDAVDVWANGELQKVRGCCGGGN